MTRARGLGGSVTSVLMCMSRHSFRHLGPLLNYNLAYIAGRLLKISRTGRVDTAQAQISTHMGWRDGTCSPTGGVMVGVGVCMGGCQTSRLSI